MQKTMAMITRPAGMVAGGMAGTATQDARRMAACAQEAWQAVRHEARGLAGTVLQRVGRIPEVESLVHGTARGQALQGLRTGDKVLAGLVVGLSAACLMATGVLFL